jgi:hypothetical protein
MYLVKNKFLLIFVTSVMKNDEKEILKQNIRLRELERFIYTRADLNLNSCKI